MSQNSKVLKNYTSESTSLSKFLEDLSSFGDIKSFFKRTLLRNIYFRKWFSWESQFKYRGLAVFIARNNSIELGLVNKICRLIERYGFIILAKKYLNKEDNKELISETSNHKWIGKDKGRGYPEVCIIVFDNKPIDLHNMKFRKWLKFYPYLENLRLIFKHSIRSAILEGIDEKQHSCLVHSTDNSEEAIYYIKKLMPESLDSIIRDINNLK